MLDLDRKRIHRYCLTMRENIEDIDYLLTNYPDNELLNDRRLLKALKYALIEIAEAMANILQHLLVRLKGEAAESYLEVVEKAKKAELINQELLSRLLFFFKFRNLLIHRYWEIDNRKLIEETRNGYKDFEAFIEAVNRKLENLQER